MSEDGCERDQCLFRRCRHPADTNKAGSQETCEVFGGDDIPGKGGGQGSEGYIQAQKRYDAGIAEPYIQAYMQDPS